MGNQIEKMPIADQVKTRKELYDIVGCALYEADYVTEPVSDGMILHLDNGYFAKLKISVCDATKFSLLKEREDYAAKCQKASERAEKNRIKAEEKAARLRDKAAKAAEKVI